MRIEIVAVGTELLLGQIADTNSAWLGEQLAAAGVDSHFHQAVGDNKDRIVLALRTALARSDGVIVTGGLGPTQDDITREAIAEVMGVPLVRQEALVRRIEELFLARGRAMPANNLRQADVPVGATVIEQTNGTAPGLICPVGSQVIYAVPGVPHEMADMFTRGILPDIEARLERAGQRAVIGSRTLRTWGASESALAEALDDRVRDLDAQATGPLADRGKVTIAFLASGIEGIKVRLTARASSPADLQVLLDAEERTVRKILFERLGDVIFGTDDESMEHAVGALLAERHLTIGLAESMTGGLISARLVNVPGASRWFRGCVVSYDAEVKYAVLKVDRGPVVTAAAARQMADGACRVLGSDVGLSVTGVAGPDEQEGVTPGTLFVGIVLPNGSVTAQELRVPGDRDRVRQYGAISALDLLRRTVSRELPIGH